VLTGQWSARDAALLVAVGTLAITVAGLVQMVWGSGNGGTPP